MNMGNNSMPVILGIVNITTDSFSDGGLYLEPDSAIQKSVQLIKDGAGIIDLGAASSNIKTTAIEPAEEIRRLKPVSEYLKSKDIPVSIDTFNPEVQKYALEAGADYINDIQGFPHPEIYPDLADSDAKLIVMYSVQHFGPATVVETEPEQVFKDMMVFFEQRVSDLEKAGVSRDRIIIDPGMGFFLGSNPAVSIYALKRIKELKTNFNLPVLVGVSRKSFLGNITNRKINERGASTLAAEIYLSYMGVDYIRTHDAAALSDALKIIECLM